MSPPKIPDPNTAAMAGSMADLENYPFKYQIDALAKMGGKAVIGGKTYDFTGLGDADNARVISDKMAQTMLDIQKNYGADFIKQRIADLKQSDPAGYAARKQLFDKILADAEANPNRPLAQETQDQVTQLLQQGGKLDAKQTEEVQQGVRGQQLRRGIYLGNAPASQEANAVVQAGEGLKTARQQQALGFQTSGVSPEDVEYRRIQQALGNLGAFVNNQSPTAQFGSLSAAGNGAAPFTTSGGVNQATNPNAGLQGIQNANSIYAGNVNWSNNQVSPWTSAVSGGLGAYDAYQNWRGSNPFLTNIPTNSYRGDVNVNPNIANTA